MIPPDIAIMIAVYAGLFMSMVVHEIAHAVTALWFGDDTAKLMGRITLDPVPHIDPVMTVLVPGILLWYSNGAFAFGGAKPVPVNPYRLRNPKHDMMWIAAAGPISNILLAVLLALSLNFVVLLGYWDQGFAERIRIVFESIIFINLLLAAFNLIPVPPLDGSKILAAFLPDRVAESYLSQQHLLLVAVLVFSGVLAPMYNSLEGITDILIKFCIFL